MADKANKSVAAQTKGTPKKNAKQNPFKAFWKKTTRFFREVVAELKKVTWPTRKELITASVAVLAFIVVFMLVLFGVDTGFTALVNLIVA